MSRQRTIFATVGVMLSLFMASMESTVIATAMPTIVSQLGGLAIYSWVFIDHVLGNDSLRKKCTSVLVPLNLMARALEFRHAVTPALASKEATVRIFVEQFNLADEFLCLDYLEPRQGTCHQRILP